MTDLLPGQVAQAALREERWQEIERADEMLSDTEVGALREPIRDGLLGVRRLDGVRYPRFQLVVRDGDATVPPAWSQLHQLLATAGWSDENLLMWTGHRMRTSKATHRRMKWRRTPTPSPPGCATRSTGRSHGRRRLRGRTRGPDRLCR